MTIPEKTLQHEEFACIRWGLCDNLRMRETDNRGKYLVCAVKIVAVGVFTPGIVYYAKKF